jgi:chemotaxis protein methyltransferase CheR
MILNMKNSEVRHISKQNHELSDIEFHGFRDWLYKNTGIHLSDIKKGMISGRLQKRLHALKLPDYATYLKLLKDQNQQAERQLALNLLTTNETYFFREDKHFAFLKDYLANARSQRNIQIWSAASSSGEEAYSIAMLLADVLGLHQNWQIFGTDINSEVLSKARRAVYPMADTKKIAQPYLQRYCQKGVGKDLGWFRINPELRQRVNFELVNLFKLPSGLAKFDVIFLRNVLIYFELEDKKIIVKNILRQLKPGGILLVGHSESIHGYDDALVQLQPSCYRYKPTHLLDDSFEATPG